jgi:hypothetical protein
MPQHGADTGHETEGSTVIDQNMITEAWRTLGHRLAAFRQAAGHGQHDFASLTHYSRSSLANVETGRQKGTRVFWQLCDELLHTDGALTAVFDEIETMVRQRHQETAQFGLQREAGQAAAATADNWQDSLPRVAQAAIALWDRKLHDELIDDALAGADTSALRWLVARPDPSTSRQAGWRRIGPVEVAHLRAVRAQLKAMDNAFGGGCAFPMAVGY